VRVNEEPDELALLDATAQAELVRNGEVEPLELVDAAIARVEALNPQLNAVVTRQFDRAREQAVSAALPDGAFRGVPFLLKDLGAHFSGDPVHSGMRVLKDIDWREPGETYFAAKVRQAGLLTIGRSNAPELGLQPTTEPLSYGASRNPWKLTHSPGGSSGGASAAVAAGLVPAAHASDGGGSIRIPANHCGLVGLKGSRGRNSFGPDAAERWGGFSCEGFVTRTVRDAAALADAAAGPMPGDAYSAPVPNRPYAAEVGADPGRLRIGMMSAPPRGEIHSDCVTAVENAGRLLESLHHTVEYSTPSALLDNETMRGFVVIIASSTAHALDVASAKIGREIGEQDVEPGTWAMATIGRTMSAADYIAAQILNNQLARGLASWWEEGFDLLLTPTCAAPPSVLGDFAATPENPMSGMTAALPYTAFASPFNVSGQPAISLPLHWNDDGLPIGVQLVAAYGREDLLIRVAAQLEQAEPWKQRRPPLHA
jgi:amidase